MSLRPTLVVPLLALLCFFVLTTLGLAYLPAITTAIAVLTVGWWVTEALPIPATSLIPFAALPLAGVIDHKIAAQALGSHVILLLMAAFMLSKALEKSLVHERLAVKLLNLIGAHSGRRLLLGFMMTAALLSMWISNTATALIMMPMALAISSAANNRKLTVALILGIAYAASVGGMGTLIGTPPNVIEMAPEVFLSLCKGQSTWQSEIEAGRVLASGALAEEAAELFPVELGN